MCEEFADCYWGLNGGYILFIRTRVGMDHNVNIKSIFFRAVPDKVNFVFR